MPADAPAPQAQEEKVYARVNGKIITQRLFDAQYAQVLKDRYYHGKVPEGKEAEVHKEVSDALVNHMLLLAEAERRGIKADEALLESETNKVRAKYADKWAPEEMARMIEEFRGAQTRRSMLAELEKAVKTAVPEPTEEQVRAYYEQHLDLFTQPEQLRASVILVKVDPSSTLDVWVEAMDDAGEIYKQLKAGADFAEMARTHSGDRTAKNGGDMGYLHRGMLPAALHDEVDKLQLGVVSEPIKGLEGYYVFRLDERQPASKMEFDKVFRRAKLLLVRESWNKAWQELKESLRSAAKIEILGEAK